MLGHEDPDPSYKLAAQIQPGDRIAIKRMKGRGSDRISIRHLGIVKGVNRDTNKIFCTVNWVAKNFG